MTWRPQARDFAMLLNRFRWEDKPRAEPAGPYERVQSVLAISTCHRVSARDRPHDGDTILSLLAVAFEPGEDGTGASC